MNLKPDFNNCERGNYQAPIVAGTATINNCERGNYQAPIVAGTATIHKELTNKEEQVKGGTNQKTRARADDSLSLRSQLVTEKDRNDMNNKEKLPTIQSLHDETIEYFNKLSGKKFKKSDNLKKRIKEGASKEELFQTIENSMGMMQDDFMQNYHTPGTYFST